MNTHCADTIYPELPPDKRVVKGCGRLLVVVPDHKGYGHTVACPKCDAVNEWPSQKAKS